MESASSSKEPNNKRLGLLLPQYQSAYKDSEWCMNSLKMEDLAQSLMYKNQIYSRNKFAATHDITAFKGKKRWRREFEEELQAKVPNIAFDKKEYYSSKKYKRDNCVFLTSMRDITQEDEHVLNSAGLTKWEPTVYKHSHELDAYPAFTTFYCIKIKDKKKDKEKRKATNLPHPDQVLSIDGVEPPMTEHDKKDAEWKMRGKKTQKRVKQSGCAEAEQQVKQVKDNEEQVERVEEMDALLLQLQNQANEAKAKDKEIEEQE